MIVPIVRNKNNKFTVAKIHFTLDPEKNTKEWVAKSLEGMTDKDGKPTPGWFREYDINYEYFAGKPFYPEFKEYNIAKEPIEYRSKQILYRGFDYGFHHPWCLVTGFNEIDQWCLMKSIKGEDEDIKTFGMRVRNFCLSEYPGAKYVDVDDIAGTQVSDKSQQTSRQMLNLVGIYPTGRKQEIAEGATIIRNKLKLRVDGQPGLLVDPREQDMIDMFKGGLHYPETKEGQPQREEYDKDGYFDHPGDILRYISTHLFSLTGQHEMSNYGIDHKHLSYQQPGMGEDIMQENSGIQDSLGGDMGGELL